MLESKHAEGVSERHFGNLVSALGNLFCKDFGERMASDVAAGEISDWFSSRGLSPASLVAYRGLVGSLFQYGSGRWAFW